MPSSDVSLPITTSNDVVAVRQAARAAATKLGFSLVDQTKIVTAASELARNTLEHGGGGTALIVPLEGNGRTGLRLTFEDSGPGISDTKLALTDGFTTKNGMGLGLSGSRRLMNEFDLWTEPGKGTRVTITKWK